MGVFAHGLSLIWGIDGRNVFGKAGFVKADKPKLARRQAVQAMFFSLTSPKIERDARTLQGPPAGGFWDDMIRRQVNTSSERLSEDQVYELSEMFRLMSDPSRLYIILSCLAEKVSVGDMVDHVAEEHDLEAT